MRTNRLFALVGALLMIAGLTSCKTSGMAMTSRGQLFKINIDAPNTLPEGGDGNVDVVLSNRGVNDIQNILVDVQLPPQLMVLDQTQGTGINVAHAPGSAVYHFTVGNLQPGEDTTLRFHVRTSFGTLRESGEISVTAWQSELPSDKLFRKTIIGLQ
ncbi:MAG TPA: hypothetical protein VKH35_14630 [Thermoanaerobaculia bacterium]|nr:hypothetical protein [Thermoanaerobaculia bacterium]